VARTAAGKMLQAMATRSAEGQMASAQNKAQAGRLMALRRGKAKPNPNAPLGQGGRFAALEQKLANKPGVTNPGGLAAAIGRRSLGKARFQKLAAAGKK